MRLRIARAIVPSIAVLLAACGGADPRLDALMAAAQEALEADAAAEAAAAHADAPGQAEAADAPAVVDTAIAPPAAAPEPSEAAAEEAQPPAEEEAQAAAADAIPPAAAMSGGEPLRASLLTGALPRAGYNGGAPVPPEARADDVSNPTTVIGTGTPASCTSRAFVRAVARGGVITFNCGSQPVTITLTATAKIVNNARARTVIDGGGKVTLSGGGRRRILYMNTCDEAQAWTTPHCHDQDHPQLTLQNLTFVDGKAAGMAEAETYGGGAVFVRGGRLKIVNSRFFRNRCDPTGPDVGGGAVRVLDQYRDLPVYVVNSTFGGRSDLGNVCSNGGALSSIGVSYTVINSLLTHNRAIGHGANPARPGTPGGGSGGAIYNDGNFFHLQVLGSKVTANRAKEGGGAIFFVSNDLTGKLTLTDSILRNNPSAGFETRGYPGIFYLGSGLPLITASTLQ